MICPRWNNGEMKSLMLNNKRLSNKLISEWCVVTNILSELICIGIPYHPRGTAWIPLTQWLITVTTVTTSPVNQGVTQFITTPHISFDVFVFGTPRDWSHGFSSPRRCLLNFVPRERSYITAGAHWHRTGSHTTGHSGDTFAQTKSGRVGCLSEKIINQFRIDVFVWSPLVRLRPTIFPPHQKLTLRWT